MPERQQRYSRVAPGRLLIDGVAIRYAKGKSRIQLLTLQCLGQLQSTHFCEFQGNLWSHLTPVDQTLREFGLCDPVGDTDAQRRAETSIGLTYHAIDTLNPDKQFRGILQKAKTGRC